ncbi:C-signal-like [Polymixia lowei]
MAARPRNVLITGANRGLGLEMVRQMVDAPHPVRKLFACCRDPDAPKSQALQALARKHPDVITVLRLDVTDLCTIEQCARQVGSLVGTEGLNLLVNNAGVLARGGMETTSLRDMQTGFNTHVTGPMYITKELLPYLRAAAQVSGTPGMSCSKAAVISISTVMASMAKVKDGFINLPTTVSYRVSKAGLNMLMLCASEEYRKDEILFALLHPGWVRTDMGGDGGAIDAQESVEGLFRVMASLTEKQNGAFLNYKGQPLPW